MVDQFFFDSISKLSLSENNVKLIKKSTENSLNKVLTKIRENFFTKTEKHSDKTKSQIGQNASSSILTTIEENEANINSNVSNKLLVAKLAKERAEREKKKLEREEKARKKMKEELIEIERKKNEEMMIKEEEKRKRVEEMIQKKEKRKKDLEYYKEVGEKEFKEAFSTKPLYVKIEENYEDQVLMPELEKKKAELARKRELFQPIRKHEIIEHMKRYQEYSYESQVRREQSLKNKEIEFKYNNSAGVFKSKFTENILEEERLKKEEQEKIEQEKKKLIEKKKKYSSIVKEMFIPSVDVFKRQEMLLIQEKLKHPVTIKLTENRSISDEENKPRKK